MTSQPYPEETAVLSTATPRTARPVVHRITPTIAVIAPAVLVAGFVYHPYISTPIDRSAVAQALVADTTRWAVSHVTVGLGSALLGVAFVIVCDYLRKVGESRWSFRAVLFLVLGSALFAMLPAMEIGVLAGTETGADAEAAQRLLDQWFMPVLLAGGVLFAVGAVCLATAVLVSGVLGLTSARIVAAALVGMALVRLVPLGASFYVGGVLTVVALWPLAYLMWRRPA
jgi:hypothetical protein